MHAAKPARRRIFSAGWAVSIGTLGMIVVAVFVASLPAAVDLWAEPCAAAVCQEGTLTPAEATALAELGLTPRGYAFYVATLGTVLAGVYFAVAALLLRLAGRRPSARYSAIVLIAVGLVFPQTLPALAATDPRWEWVVDGAERIAAVAFLAWALTFPDGRFRPRWTAAAAVGLAGYVGAGMLDIGPAPGGSVDIATTVLAVGLVIGVQAYRYRHADEVDRQRIQWVTAGIAVAVFGLLLASVAQGPLGVRPGSLADLVVQGGIVLAFLLIPVTIAAAVLHRGLWDVSATVGRAVTYGLLSLGVVVTYTSLVAAATALLAVDRTGITITAAGLVAVALHPAYVRLRSWVNRLLYGERDDPAALLRALTERLESAAEPDAVLGSVAESLVRGLRLPYARVAVGAGDAPVAEAGRLPPGWPTEEVTLTYQGLPVGTLTVALRDRDGPSDQDRQAVATVARRAASLAHGVLLTDQLSRSRQALVTAREEERRRLRNDLHDGLGPALGAVRLKLAAAENKLADGDQVAAGQLIGDARAQAGSAVTEVRRLGYGLRPPALDELGLVAAISTSARGLAAGGVQVSVSTPGSAPLPELPAAVEVAAYRIAVEAVTNVVRHAHATTCDVVISVTDHACTVEVIDDGVGAIPGVPSGIGLASMRERASELGGKVEIESQTGVGTTVRAHLPLLAASTGEERPDGRADRAGGRGRRPHAVP